MSELEIEHLLFGSRNGAVLLHFIGAGMSLQITWREFIENLETIQVWGERPCKRRFYDALHNHVNLDARKALFQRLAAQQRDTEVVVTLLLCCLCCVERYR
jgi:hypothetical protein